MISRLRGRLRTPGSVWTGWQPRTVNSTPNARSRNPRYDRFDRLVLCVVLGDHQQQEGTLIIRQLFRSRPKERFQARSPERDVIADHDAVKSVAAALDVALEKAEAERLGLKNRLDNVLSVAALVGGNDIDDYLTRNEDRSDMLNESDVEIRRGQERL